jgi:hypothetical protein
MTSETVEPGRYQAPAPMLVRDREPRVGRVMFLLFALPLVFSVGRYLPAFSWTIELGIALSIVLAGISMVSNRPRVRDPFTIYLMLVAFGLPILSALGAYIAFQQPIFYGVAAQRGCLFALFAFAAGNLLADGRLTIREFQRALIVLAWINLAVCTFVVTAYNPNDYSDLPGLVTDGGGIFNEFILPITFIVFGGLYYFCKWTLGGRPTHGLMAAPFFLYIVAAHGGRSAILALIGTIAVVSWIGSPSKRFTNVLAAIILAAATMLLVEAALPGTLDKLFVSFGDAFSVVFGAKNVADVSANVRIIEAEIAWPYVFDHPILGTGTISSQWYGGYAAMFGYFHPSDLGLLGLLFTYGIIGIIFFGIQYVIIIRSYPIVSRLVRRIPDGDFLLATTALITFFLASSLATGLFILNPEQTLILFILMMAQARRCYIAQ